MSAKISVAIFTGGNSAEKEVSLQSAQIVFQNLDDLLYEKFIVDISYHPWKVKNATGETFEIDLNTCSISETKQSFDVAFLAIHGTPAEDGKLQGYLDLMGIPYSASSVLASAITFDKGMTKALVSDLGIPMAKSILFTHVNGKNIADVNRELTYPVFVKPNKNGSSYGVSKVKVAAEFEQALAEAFKYDDEVLVEEFIDGRELACGIIKDEGELICFPITEISTENEFFDYEAKYLGKSKEVTPAPITNEQVTRCHQYTKQIYHYLKLSGAARVDYFLKGDELYLLEVNTIPGLSSASILPQQAQAYGWSLATLFHKILQNAMLEGNNLSGE